MCLCLLLLFQFFTCDFSETTVIRQVFLILHLLVFFHLLVLFSVLMWVFIFYINDLILNSMYLPPTQVGNPIVLIDLWFSNFIFQGHFFLYPINNAKYFFKFTSDSSKKSLLGDSSSFESLACSFLSILTYAILLSRPMLILTCYFHYSCIWKYPPRPAHRKGAGLLLASLSVLSSLVIVPFLDL